MISYGLGIVTGIALTVIGVVVFMVKWDERVVAAELKALQQPERPIGIYCGVPVYIDEALT